MHWTDGDPADSAIGKTVRLALFLKGGEGSVLVKSSGVSREVVRRIPQLLGRQYRQLLGLDRERERRRGTLPQRLLLTVDPANLRAEIGGSVLALAREVAVGSGGFGGQWWFPRRFPVQEHVLLVPPRHERWRAAGVGGNREVARGSRLGPASCEDTCLGRSDGLHRGGRPKGPDRRPTQDNK